MFKILLRLSLGFGVFFALLIGAGTIIGQGIDTPVITALIRSSLPSTSASASGQSSEPGTIALIDLNRLLRADRPIPIEHIQYQWLNFSDPGQLLATTYNRVRTANTYSYEGGLYQYDYVHDTMYEIALYESRLAGLSTNINYHHTPPVSSADGRKLAFIDPLDLRLNLYDTETHQATVLSDLHFPAGTLPMISWSPDGSLIALQRDNLLYVVNTADGSVQEHTITTGPSGYFYSTWSKNRLWLQPLGSSLLNPPVRLIELTDEPAPESLRELQGRLNPMWGCEDQWLGQIVIEGTLSAMYLFDLQSGSSTRLNDHPVLAQQGIERIAPLSNCRQFIVYGTPTYDSMVNRMLRPLYFFDSLTNEVELIDETASVVQVSDDRIAYEKAVPNASRLQLFERQLDPMTELILLGEYPALETTWSYWSPDLSFATFIRPVSANISGGVIYHLTPKTGQIFPLTPGEYVEAYDQRDWSALKGTE